VTDAPPSSLNPTTLDEALALITQLRERHVVEVEQLRSEKAVDRAEIDELRRANQKLRHELEKLAKRMFGRKTDELDPRQLQLAMEQLANEVGAPDEPVEMDSGELTVKEHRRKKKGRRQIPANLPRHVINVEPSEGELTCGCGTRKMRIMEEASEKIDYVPSSFQVVRTVRGVWACQKCHDGVTVAPTPPQAVEKGLAAEGLLAQVVAAKFADHQPLHRQQRIYARAGLDLSVSTMCGWIAAVADAVSPIVDHLRRRLVTAKYVQTDDTPITVLGENGDSFKGRIWTYFDPLDRLVLFEATPTHHAIWPQEHLRGFEGYLQADAYSGYNALYESGRIKEVGCWAHARRRFVDAVPTAPEAARMVALIAKLYAVEEAAREMSPELRHQTRLERSKPILDLIHTERRRLADTTLPKSPLGEALGYLHRQWLVLQRFLEDGHLLPDNNNAERQLRTVALGRKNWLFAGSLDGARRAAVLYSLVQSCRLAGVDCWAYLRDVLLKVVTVPHHRIAELAPDRWAASRTD
jgi:transposase